VIQRYNSALSFAVNYGQADPATKYLARGSGYTVLLTPTEAVMVIAARGGEETETTRVADAVTRQSRGVTVLRTKLVGANTSSQISGLEELPGKVNYLLGSDPEKWQSDVKTFARVRCGDVYQGIDLVYYGNQRQLEYDFIVAPEANPADITLGFEGAEEVFVDQSGDLVLRTSGAEVRQCKPVVYQEIEGLRREIPGRYLLLEGRPDASESQSPQLKAEAAKLKTVTVTFEIGEYDRSLPLVIDPVLAFSTYLGGSAGDFASDIAVDAAGNVYITGTTSSINFPTANAFQPVNNGGAFGDVFVTKLDAVGSLVYSTYLGGAGDEEGSGIAVDSEGRACVAGFTRSTNFPTANALQPSFGGGSGDVFIAKLRPSGSGLVYSTYLGGSGSGSDSAAGIAVDTAGNAYVAGQAFAGFPLMNPLQASNFGFDGFVAKINAEGSALVYSTFLGGSESDNVDSIAVDSQGNASVAGRTLSTDFPIASAFQPVFGGGSGQDSFVARLNAQGSAFIFSSYLGGSGTDVPRSIAADLAGNVYVGGTTASQNFPVANAVQAFLRGTTDGFVTKVSPSGSLIYSTYVGGTATETITDVGVDADGIAYLVGFTRSADFPTMGALQGSLAGVVDAFVSKLNSTGTGLLFSTYLGGSGDEFAGALAVDGVGGVYVAGETSSLDFRLSNPVQPTFGGGEADAFVAKIIETAAPEITAAQINGKKLIVEGKRFDNRAELLMDGVVQKKTKKDAENPSGRLIAKKSGKKIAPGQTVTLQVRNPDQSLSNLFPFTRD
jgi:hypothetical protein